jgi:ATP-dependent RNA helicase RhlB
MFDLGFITDIRYLFRRMSKPEDRLNMLFSATLSHRVNELAYEHMNNPEQVIVERDQLTADRITESLYYPAMDEKMPLLFGLLQSRQDERVVIFINTKRVAEKIDAYFRGNGINGAVLSGDVPQNKRLRLLDEFTQGKLRALVATDVAARGLHIPEVGLVINYDLPQDAEDYVHRIGRTGRAGASGEAVSFACEEYVFSLPEIEEYVGHKIPVAQITAELLVKPQPPAKIERHVKPHHHKSDHRNKKPHHAGKPHHHKQKTSQT